MRNRRAHHGARLIDAQFPELAAVMTAQLPDRACRRLFVAFYHNRSCRNWPPPSVLFPGLDPRFNDRLRQAARDKDVPLGRALAAIPKDHQHEFLDLYLADPVDARRWASLPLWQRPIRHGGPDDRLIWKFFIMQQLNMQQAASDAPPWALASQGAQLPQMFGVLSGLSLSGLHRLCDVLSSYGWMLQHGQDVGDVVTPPWERTTHK